MGQGKHWSAEECLHLAEAWVNASEDEGEKEVKGTYQDSDSFWAKVLENFTAKSPPHPQGIYHDRALTAIKNKWKDKISRDVKKFNKSLLKVYKSNPTGCTEQNKVNMAVAIHLGQTLVMSYVHKEFEAFVWKYYTAWQVLKEHRAFISPSPPTSENLVELEGEEEEEVGTSSPGTGNEDSGGDTNAGKNLFATTALHKGRSCGPGGGCKKTKAKAAEDDYRKKKTKLQEDFLEVQRQKSENFASYVTNQARAEA